MKQPVHESAPRRWIVLLAHGSTDAQWRRPFERLRARLAQELTNTAVELAYVQLGEPTLAHVLEACRAAGAEEALVIPLFLSGGGQLLRDVPQAVTAAALRAGIRARTTAAIGEQPEVLEAMLSAMLRLAD